jgi:hypothetical protein
MGGHPQPPRLPRSPRGERGVGLIEVMVATIIATLAIIALAWSFGTGRALVNRFEVARMALAAAQRRMELLEAAPYDSPDLALGPGYSSTTHGPRDVLVDGSAACQESWQVVPVHDPANPGTPAQPDLKKVTVTVTWGGHGLAETIQLTRLFPL